MLFPCYSLTSRDVNFRYPDRVTQTEFCRGWPLVISGTCGKFAAGVVDTGGNNTIELVAKFAAGVVDTGGAP
jgi:hypothetical protein